MKLTIAQSTLLRVIAEASKGENGRIPWYARGEALVEGKLLSFEAIHIARALTALINKKLILPYEKLGKYSCIITDEGEEVALQEKGKPITFLSHLEKRDILYTYD